MYINQYLESTYLKTSAQAGISETETRKIVTTVINEAIENNFKLVMLRPRFVTLAKKMIGEAKSQVLIGTVIGFHEGTNTIEQKLKEIKLAINNGANDVDIVINYKAFLKGNTTLIKKEVSSCTNFVLQKNKTVKWIIEIAAFDEIQISKLVKLIKDTVLLNFHEKQIDNVFIKTSTGFYKTNDNKPNGATFEGIEIMLKNATPLPVKAAGGIKSYHDALKMINLGVSRIGTSSAKAIVDKQHINSDY